MRRALLIFNPAAARSEAEVLRAISRTLAAEGWDVEIAGTTRPGSAGELAQQAIEDGVDRIAVYGGDGTATDVFRGAVGHDVPVGLIPGGTGNLLAGNLRLPRDPVKAARVVAQGVPRRIDLGRVPREDGERYFAVACGTGVDAAVMAGATTKAKRRWGMGAYVAQTMRSLGDLKAVPHRITADRATIDTPATMVLVANCGEMMPPYVRIRDEVVLDDGVLDVVVVNAATVMQGLDVLWRALAGRVQSSPYVRFVRARQVTVETEQPRPMQLDGETAGVTPFTAKVMPAAIRILVPGGD